MARVRVIQDEDEWFALEPAWERLLQQSASDCFFLTWPWLRAWWDTYRDRYQLLVVVAEDENELCGIAPLVVSRDGQLEFMGTNAAWGEYLDFAVLRGREQELAKALAARVLELGELPVPAWRTAFFRFVRRDAACAPFLRSVFSSAGRSLVELEADGSPYIELPSTWDEYLSAHSANFRSWITRNESRVAQLGPSRLLFAGEDLPLDRAFDWFTELHADRWGRPFDSRFVEFHRRVSSALLPLGRLKLVLLEVAGEPVAAKYDFLYGGKLWCYQGGWRRDLASYRLGNVLLARFLQWAIESGCSEYDFLAGDVPYKRRWSNASRETVNLVWPEGHRPVIESISAEDLAPVGPAPPERRFARPLSRLKRRHNEAR